MIKIITATERPDASVGDWLKSRYLFSFADYYDPANVQFGPLRVFNDDYVAPHSGFPEHSHSEMEIVTVVLSGELKHRDSLGNEGIIRRGDVQRMSAGTGITHSEMNESDEEVHLFQLWFFPNKSELAPSYEQMSLDFLNSKNELIPLATGQKVLEDVVFINSNSTIYYAKLAHGEEINFRTFKIRKTLIYVASGSLIVNSVEADKNDQIRLEDHEAITIHASSDASFVLIDVPALEVNY